jgi:protein-tyrosine phosphatase
VRAEPISYLRFDVADWKQCVDGSSESVRAFVAPLVSFVGPALAGGGNVLVHCMAGAHRAGTVGCLCLIELAGMSAEVSRHPVQPNMLQYYLRLS